MDSAAQDKKRSAEGYRIPPVRFSTTTLQLLSSLYAYDTDTLFWPVSLSLFLSRVSHSALYFYMQTTTCSYDGAERKDGRPWPAFTENFLIIRLARGYHDFQVMRAMSASTSVLV